MCYFVYALLPHFCYYLLKYVINALLYCYYELKTVSMSYLIILIFSYFLNMIYYIINMFYLTIMSYYLINMLSH